MGDISVGSGTATSQLAPFSSRAKHELSKVDELNVTVSDGEGQYKVSAEAQYLFEMQVYFHTLDAAEQERAVDYFAKSDDPLNNKVAADFRKIQEFARGIREGTITIVKRDETIDKVKDLFDPNAVIDGTTEIGVRPYGTEIFRMDEKKNYSPASGSGSNSALIKELEALEKAASGLLRNRDAANLFGSVSNFLSYSQHIFLSADDVLHYNYAIAKVKQTIEFLKPPEDLTASLNAIMARGIAWQNEEQSTAMMDARKLLGNNRVGRFAAEALRMGSAAQVFNHKLLDTFKSPHISFLKADFQIKGMMFEQPDLIQFNPTKIGEALDFYRHDDAEYAKALNRGFFEPAPEWKDPLTDNDKKIFAASKNYALKVIEEIQGYVVGSK